jgi:hypothetical protein
MATTTNFGWTTPDDTSLVKDGAAAIRSLGQAIDTSLMDLEGGTTGQSLTKNSNTDMDFVWATPASGSMTQLASGTLSGTSVSLTSISQSYKDLKLVVTGLNATNAMISIRTNTETASTYKYVLTREAGVWASSASSRILCGASADGNNNKSTNVMTFFNYAQSTAVIPISIYGVALGAQANNASGVGFWTGTLAAITSIQIEAQGDAMSGGSYVLYGVN